MRIANKKLLIKYLKKNRGNTILSKAIIQLVNDLESRSYKSSAELKEVRADANRVHNHGFYFFNLSDHRTMILMEIMDDEATIVWCGDHDKYEMTFKNNKKTIHKWLRNNDWI